MPETKLGHGPIADDEVRVACSVSVPIDEAMSSGVYAALLEPSGDCWGHSDSANGLTSDVRVFMVKRADAPRDWGVPDVDELWEASVVGTWYGSALCAYVN